MVIEDEFSAFPSAVRSAHAVAGDGSVTLGTGQRATWVRFLTRILTDTPVRDFYSGEWARLSRGSPLSPELKTRIRNLEIPAEAAVRNGLDALTDAQLAALAAQPDTLNLLANLIAESAGDGDLGDVWWEPLRAAARDESPASHSEAVNRLLASVTRADRPAPLQHVSVPTKADGRYTRYLPWALTAASILFAVGVWSMNRPPTGGGEVVSAGAELYKKGTLGPNDVFGIRVTNPRDGFATVVVLTPKPPWAVYPEFGQDDIRVSKGQTAQIDPIQGPAGTRVLVFVTETPATEVIRRILDQVPPGTNDEAELRRRVADGLFRANHRWVGQSQVILGE